MALQASISKARAALTAVPVKKPRLSTKLLRRPPFRFIHAIVLSVNKQTGFGDGLYTDEELGARFDDRRSKLRFLNKTIACVSFALQQPVAARAVKITAGLEPALTNDFLAALAQAATATSADDGARCVARVLQLEKDRADQQDAAVAIQARWRGHRARETAPPRPSAAAGLGATGATGGVSLAGSQDGDDGVAGESYASDFDAEGDGIEDESYLEQSVASPFRHPQQQAPLEQKEQKDAPLPAAAGGRSRSNSNAGSAGAGGASASASASAAQQGSAKKKNKIRSDEDGEEGDTPSALPLHDDGLVAAGAGAAGAGIRIVQCDLGELLEGSANLPQDLAFGGPDDDEDEDDVDDDDEGANDETKGNDGDAEDSGDLEVLDSGGAGGFQIVQCDLGELYGSEPGAGRCI